MSYWVYIHTCKANGKRYVGCTTRVKPEYRWGRNGEGYLYNDHFRSAILKHGWNNFEHEVFEVDSKEEMYYAEKYLIAYYHTTESKYGYNNSTGGEKSSLGCKHSEETRQRISESKKGKSHLGKPCSEETRRKISEANKGKTRSEEIRKKRSEVQKEKWLDSEYRRKMSEAHKGKPLSKEHREHMSEAKKGRPLPRIKISLPDGTVLEVTKQNLTRDYINKGRKFEYVS